MGVVDRVERREGKKREGSDGGERKREGKGCGE